jgi:hypothetical protein
MKTKLTMLSLLVPIIFIACSKDDDKDFSYATVNSCRILGHVTDSLTGIDLEHTVICIKGTYSTSISGHTVTNDLGNFSISVSVSVNSISDYTVYVSKGGYDLAKVRVLVDSSDVEIDVPLVPVENDTIQPFCLKWYEQSDSDENQIEVTIYFSEEVTFDLNHLQDLAQIIFRRNYDICSYGNAYIYEHQDDYYSITETSVKFVHKEKDTESCFDSYYNTFYDKTAYWDLYSIQLLPYLCKDGSGNFLEEFMWLSK